MARAFTRGRCEAHPPLHLLRPAFGVHRLSRSHSGPVGYRIHLTWPAGASAAAEGNGPVPGAARQGLRSEYGRVPVADARQAGLRPARDHTPALHGPRRCKHTVGPRSSQPLRVAARAGISPRPGARPRLTAAAWPGQEAPRRRGERTAPVPSGRRPKGQPPGWAGSAAEAFRHARAPAEPAERAPRSRRPSP